MGIYTENKILQTVIVVFANNIKGVTSNKGVILGMESNAVL